MADQQQRPPPMQPEVVIPPPGRRYVIDGDQILPAFPMVADHVDRYARRLPWWVWALVGFGLGSGFPSKLFTRARKAADY